MSTDDKCLVSCALNGVLTNPYVFEGIPVTPEQMAASAKEAFDAGATTRPAEWFYPVPC